MRTLRYVTILLAIVTCLLPQSRAVSLRQNQTWPSRNYPGNLEFPTRLDLDYFGKQLDGELITPYDSEYLNESITSNRMFKRLPALIVKPESLKDVQRSVLFAQKHNLHLTVRSSGHDFIGRSMHDGSLNLNLKGMNKIKVNMNSSRNKAGEVTVQTGASWLEVYTEIDKVRGPDETGQKTIGRVIVGAAALSLAMGGYTQGGGHSPIGRKFGLAVDNLLEATIVTTDAKVHKVNGSLTMTYDLDGSVSITNDTSLYWAIRGGGGGTWGTVLDFTYKIHYAPERFREISLRIPIQDKSDYGQVFDSVDRSTLWQLLRHFGAPNEYIGKFVNRDTMGSTLEQINQLSSDWGGYFISSPQSTFGVFDDQHYLVLSLVHYGSDSSSSNDEIEMLLRDINWTVFQEIYHKTYLHYQMAFPELTYYSVYTFSSFIQKPTLENSTTRAGLVDVIYDMLQDNILSVGILIGGNMANVQEDSTPVHPGFRSGTLVMFCQMFSQLPLATPTLDRVLGHAQKVYKFGTGSYFNEPAEDLSDWKAKFWDREETYERLLAIKKRVDPTNYLWCHNCVGSDLGYNYTSLDYRSLPGLPARSYFQTSIQFDQI